MWLRSRRSATGWPPIVVTEDHVLVDGHHRVAAAEQLGLDRIAAVVFKGSRADAYIEAVRSNISHGMPLTLSERRRAGVQILAVHPTWSDRRIAGCCGLSAKTIKRLRDESGSFEDCRSGGARGPGVTGASVRSMPAVCGRASLPSSNGLPMRRCARSPLPSGRRPKPSGACGTSCEPTEGTRALRSNPRAMTTRAWRRPPNAMTVGSRSAKTSRSRPERTARASLRGLTALRFGAAISGIRPKPFR